MLAGMLCLSLSTAGAEEAPIELSGEESIFDFLNPAHERRSAELVRQRHPDIAVFASTDIFPAFRELPRTTSVAVNAYISPRVDAYLAEMEQGLRAQGFHGLFTVMKVEAASPCARR